jgi:hypothetical protein
MNVTALFAKAEHGALASRQRNVEPTAKCLFSRLLLIQAQSEALEKVGRINDVTRPARIVLATISDDESR